MRVLVAVASQHGSTQGIAEAIADELRAEGLAADLTDVKDVVDIVGYDAVVLGSAVYIGKWMPEARRFVERHQARLAAVPVWLFSSGPLGDEPKPGDDDVRIADLIAMTNARDHRVFSGRLEKEDLSLREKLVVRMVHAPLGDYRDWDAIRGWARGIGAALVAEVPA
jgi:menaquinone-dependent protoporphyrinogen oxidase